MQLSNAISESKPASSSNKWSQKSGRDVGVSFELSGSVCRHLGLCVSLSKAGRSLSSDFNQKKKKKRLFEISQRCFISSDDLMIALFRNVTFCEMVVSLKNCIGKICLQIK